MRRENDFICEWGMFDLNSSKKIPRTKPRWNTTRLFYKVTSDRRSSFSKTVSSLLCFTLPSQALFSLYLCFAVPL